MLCKINDPDDWIDRVHHKWYLWSHFEGRYYWMWTAVIIRSLITHLTVITSRYGVFPSGPLMVGPINNFDHCSRGNKGFNWCKRITDSNQGLVLAWNRLRMIQSPRSNISTFVVRILTHIKSQGKKNPYLCNDSHLLVNLRFRCERCDSILVLSNSTIQAICLCEKSHSQIYFLSSE